MVSPEKVPQISVLIPVYNEERFIGRCIRSILNQTFPQDAYEVIVVNDGSTDRTRYALSLFAGAVEMIENPKQLGLAGSLNVALRRARGQFIVRLDGDDYVNSEYIQILSLFLRQNPHWDAAACDYFLVDDDERVISRKNGMEEPLGCGIMFRMEHLLDIGMYDDHFRLHEDKDLRLRFLKKYRIHHIELPLYRYRQHAGNSTNNVGKMEEYAKALENKHGSDWSKP